MGYYATCDGFIKLKSKPPINIDEMIRDTFDIYEYDKELYEYRFGADEKYHEDVVMSLLTAVEPYTEEGCIRYHGEDNEHWRFLFKDGTWMDETGWVIYESEEVSFKDTPDKMEFLSRIVDAFEDFLEKKKISWENSERDDNPSAALFYGTEYGQICDELSKIMKDYNIFT